MMVMFDSHSINHGIPVGFPGTNQLPLVTISEYKFTKR